MSLPAFSYVLPLRMADGAAREELTRYLTTLAQWCDDVIVVDGSPPGVFAENGRAWGDLVRHVTPDPAHASLMGKVPGVLTGVDLASHERVVIADDDVRYDRPGLARLLELLEGHDLVRPQNFFLTLPWHARWDTARTLLNRATGADFPGTLGVRRSALREVGGYDGDVLFENLELIRTIDASGGRVATPLDLFVARLPPSASHFWGQRTRQAYDDFGIPARMAVWLSILPAMVVAAARRDPRGPLLGAAVTVAVAEAGRRRAAGRRVFPGSSALLAPVWVLERGVCAWLAVLQRLRFGGVRYGNSVIRVAAHSRRELRRRGTVARGRSESRPIRGSDISGSGVGRALGVTHRPGHAAQCGE
ncbi:MAG TPA: glycosyltransferase family 2 protein [Solirubrobacteraceae bacterium]|nr:glycosyltransferase family 2 protein [Solirubrobacteraceae bacterium]